MEFVCGRVPITNVFAATLAGGRSSRRTLNRGPDANFQALSSLIGGGRPSFGFDSVPAVPEDERGHGKTYLVACCDSKKRNTTQYKGRKDHCDVRTRDAAEMLACVMPELPRTYAPVPGPCVLGGVSYDLSLDASVTADPFIAGFSAFLADTMARSCVLEPQLVDGSSCTSLLAHDPATGEDILIGKIVPPDVGDLEELVPSEARCGYMAAKLDAAAMEAADRLLTSGPSFALLPCRGDAAGIDSSVSTRNGIQILVPLQPILGGRTDRLPGWFKPPGGPFVNALFNVSVRPDVDMLFVEFDSCPYCGREGYFPPAYAHTCYCKGMRDIPSYGARDLGPVRMAYVAKDYPFYPNASVRRKTDQCQIAGISTGPVAAYRQATQRNSSPTFFWWLVGFKDRISLFSLIEDWLRLGLEYAPEPSYTRHRLLCRIVYRMIEMHAFHLAIGRVIARKSLRWCIIIPEMGLSDDENEWAIDQQYDSCAVGVMVAGAIARWLDRCGSMVAIIRAVLMSLPGSQYKAEFAEYSLGFHRQVVGLSSLQAICRHAVFVHRISVPRGWYSVLPIWNGGCGVV